MSVTNGSIITRKQKVVASTVLVGGTVAAVYLRRKYNIKIEQAGEAAVSDWINDIHATGCTMLVVTQALADRLYVQMNDAAQAAGDMQPFTVSA